LSDGYSAGAPTGRIYGYVMKVEGDLETCDGPKVGGAWVGAESQEYTYADGGGYFEFDVIPGDHLIAARADGYIDGAAHCPVAAGGEIFCCVPLIPDPEAELPEEDPDDEEPWAGGCTVTGTSGALSLMPLFLLGILFVRRRKS
jgi:MYXO-CTERM domain-containing protein